MKEEEEVDEETARLYLGRRQSLVKKGVGLLAKENAVVLIAVRKYRDAGASRGQALMSQTTEAFAGVSLHQLHGCITCVATADHCVAGIIRQYRQKRWQLQVYAMLAVQFQGLTQSELNLNGLI